MSKEPFRKPALKLEDQIALLEGRGLGVPDRALAKQLLENISYYRFSGYTRYFASSEDEKRQVFRENVAFDDVINLYVFDRRLRVLLAEAFERIEVAVKGGLAYHGSIAAGPFWMSDPNNFEGGSHNRIMELIKEACVPSGGRYKQVFLDAYFKKYSDPIPPAWMVTEVLSFHGASMIYKSAKGHIRIPIAQQFGVQQDVLGSWLHALVFARNVCAHHARFWNRRFTISPKIPRKYQEVWPESARSRLYVTCAIVRHMLNALGGEADWHKRLQVLINNRPSVPLIDMGFPDNWEREGFWGFDQT